MTTLWGVRSYAQESMVTSLPTGSDRVMLKWRLWSHGSASISKWILLPIVTFGSCLLLAAIVAEAQAELSEKNFVNKSVTGHLTRHPAYAKI